jgi:anthranilate synthase component 2
MIVIIDNYDSFTYNLYQYIGEIDEDVRVFRNDKITVDELEKMAPSHLVISPGPGYPQDAGISIEAIQRLGQSIPVLGVCLGHQAIGAAFGGDIIHAEKLVHGKAHEISIHGGRLFGGIPMRASVGRYHSLVVDRKTIPKELTITAQTFDGEIMAMQHNSLPIYGLQFHPESILTPIGKQILRNFLDM